MLLHLAQFIIESGVEFFYNYNTCLTRQKAVKNAVRRPILKIFEKLQKKL